MRGLTLVCLLIIWQITAAQRHKVELTGNIGSVSNAISNSFADALLQGEFITESLKDHNSSNLKPLNYFMGYINASLKWSVTPDSLFGKPNLFFTTELSSTQHLNAVFKPDAIELLLRGNSYFAGETAILTGTRINQFSYQQLKFGLGQKLGNSSIEYQLGIVKGNSFLTLALNKAELFTESNGQSVAADFDMLAAQSDTSTSGFWPPNGWGLSGHVNFNYKSPDKRHFIQLRIKDLGYIWWNWRSMSYLKDTAQTYAGIDISNALGTQPGFGNGLTFSDADFSFFQFEKDRGTITTFMPAQFKLGYQYQISSRNRTGIGIHQFMIPGILPEFSLNHQYVAIWKTERYDRTTGLPSQIPALAFNGNIAYGGFGLLNIGLGLSAQLPMGLEVVINSRYFQGWLINKAFARSLAIKVAYVY